MVYSDLALHVHLYTPFLPTIFGMSNKLYIMQSNTMYIIKQNMLPVLLL